MLSANLCFRKYIIIDDKEFFITFLYLKWGMKVFIISKEYSNSPHDFLYWQKDKSTDKLPMSSTKISIATDYQHINTLNLKMTLWRQQPEGGYGNAH